MSIRSFSIHAHFYQPPREDPITGIIPIEAGASPFKNWNERIYAECYRPNADLGNFERVSFNVGPTLFDWLEQRDQQTSLKIVAQDQANVKRFGVGNAMAQSYIHTILPLASAADKETQVVWGIADFEYRFNRKPQGMWLPETAVDLETLSVLAEHGIEFTILAPWQAAQDSIDVTEPYWVHLPSGRSITVFFYDADLSSLVSFDANATTNADKFLNDHLLPKFKDRKRLLEEPQMLIIASDGELYGHHKEFRDIFLSHLVNGASAQIGLSPSYPALWLEIHSPRQAVAIRENTSWSCHHGVVRWKDECGCTAGDGVWKAYLRQAFDRLAVSLEQVYVNYVRQYVSDPYELRNRFIHVMLGELCPDELINDLACRPLSKEVVEKITLLLEAQRERQRMFTSCGWFFEDFSRIEPKNNVAYAAQAVRLTQRATGIDLGPQAIADLQNVISNRTGMRGDVVFRRQLHRVEVQERDLRRC